MREEIERYADLEEMENLFDIGMDAVPGDFRDFDEITYQSIYRINEVVSWESDKSDLE